MGVFLHYVTRQCRKDQTETDAAVKDNHCLNRKVSKAKEVVDELRTNLKGARLEVRHCKSFITEVEDNLGHPPIRQKKSMSTC